MRWINGTGLRSWTSDVTLWFVMDERGTWTNSVGVRKTVVPKKENVPLPTVCGIGTFFG